MAQLLSVTSELNSRHFDTIFKSYNGYYVSAKKENGYSTILEVTQETDVINIHTQVSFPQTIDFNKPNFLCLLYSTNKINWNNGHYNDSLEHGGITVFDSIQPFTYTASGSVSCIFIPYHFYDDKTVNTIIKGHQFIYSDSIQSIIREMICCEDNDKLHNKILSIIYLLPHVIENKPKNINEISLYIRINKIIEDNFIDAFFSLDKAATLSYCSKRKLHNCLTEKKTSYSKLITEYRVNHLAKQLLLKRNSSIVTLCYESGFNSASYASKTFKIMKGMTPMQYRKTYLV